MEYFILYLFSIADNISCLLGILSLFMLASSIFSAVMLSYSVDEEYETYVKNIKRFAIYAVICWIVQGFIPSTKDMYMIFGVGKTIEYVQSSDEIKELPDNAVKALNYYLEEITKEKE